MKTTTLIAHHIGNLRLREYAPFPRHCSDTKDMIRASRELQGITPHTSAKQAHPEGFSNNAGESSTSGDTARVYTFNQNDCSQNVNRRDK